MIVEIDDEFMRPRPGEQWAKLTGGITVVANAQMWGGLFWLAIGAYVTWVGRDLGLGRIADPGSGFAFFWIGLIMCALSASVIVQALSRGSESIQSLWDETRWQKVLLVTVMLLVFGFLFEFLGFIVCALALLLILMFFIDPVEPKLALLVSIGSTFVVWAALTEALKIQLPAGILAGAPEGALRAIARGGINAVSAVFQFIFR